MHPISFKPDMVKAILDKGKCMTRRPIKLGWEHWRMKSFAQLNDGGYIFFDTDEPVEWRVKQCNEENSPGLQCPYGKVGDKLYVREKYAIVDISCYTESDECYEVCIMYSDESTRYVSLREPIDKSKLGKLSMDDNAPINWRYPPFFRREYSRLTLEITSLRVERLQEISEEDAVKEGMRHPSTLNLIPFVQERTEWYLAETCRDMFQRAWCEMYGTAAWESNPWVWVIGFKVVNTGER